MCQAASLQCIHNMFDNLGVNQLSMVGRMNHKCGLVHTDMAGSHQTNEYTAHANLTREVMFKKKVVTSKDANTARLPSVIK